VAIITFPVHDDHMTASVIHQPRVAWDGACAFVRAAGAPAYPVFADYVRSALGPEIQAHHEETHQRVYTNLIWNNGDRYVTDVEAGKWRARLEDLLRNRPELTGTLMDLTAMVPR
jgi:hypothetical protein